MVLAATYLRDVSSWLLIQCYKLLIMVGWWKRLETPTRVVIVVLALSLMVTIFSNPQPDSPNLAGSLQKVVVASTTTTTQPELAPIPQSDITGYSRGVPEVANPSSAEMHSKCIDVTSYDYDWDDDEFCTRSDGSDFYTNYSGAYSAES